MKLSKERLEEISSDHRIDFGSMGLDEVREMARRLLAAEAQVDEVARQAGINPAVAESYMQGYHDSESRRQQPVQVPDAVDYSDLDQNSQDREVIEAINQCKGWNAYRAAMLAAAPQVAQPVQEPEWTNEQCLEFLSIAFRHAEIKGDLELDDIRLGVKMTNAMLTAPAQPIKVPECFSRLLKHAYGMSMGKDWNNGTMAGHHREGLCKAVEDCRAAFPEENNFEK